MPPDTYEKNLTRRDRIAILSVLGASTVSAWTYLINMAVKPDVHGIAHDAVIPCMMKWGPGEVIVSFIMWSVMMVAMMVPAAAPMFLAFAAVNRDKNVAGHFLIATGWFVLGYLVVWLAFSAAATLIQWALHTAVLLWETAVTAGPIAGGALLCAAGVFQWMPFRDVCMTKCRSPFGFILTEWREGKGGALIMGLKHGAYCVGCCWLLMALSLVLGIMNLIWMGALTAFMAMEKGGVGGVWLSRATGVILVAWGLAVVFLRIMFS